MDLQGTKEARTQEEGTDGPLDAYGASSGRSKEFRKNERPDSHSHENSSTVNTLRHHQPPFTYPPSTRQPGAASRSGSGSTSSAAPRPRDPSPSPEAISIPQALGFGSRDQRLLCKARRQPPVTKRTLSELDLPCIMGNINLRMDANFDRDLHFKPDLDGEKGKRKRKEAADYWDSMAMEIAIYAYRAANPDDDIDEKSVQDSNSKRTFEPRLPAMFETLQEVIKTLVPERDHPSVMQNLEVPLLMQQVRKGVLDMVALATWMAALLKTHCAPMRDEWADRMVEQITEGSQSQEPKKIVNGLQTLFAILEAMKLDVANHQIRTFRVLLIEDTVPFLQEYFEGKLSRGGLEVEPARIWYIGARERARKEDEAKGPDAAQSNDTFEPLEALLRGISDLLLQFNPPEKYPETFLFDTDRLWQLRSTIQNLINLEIAWYIFESYVHTQKRYLSARDETYSTFRSRIWSLMEEEMSSDGRSACENDDPDVRGSKRWLQNMRCIALEIARFACAACCLDVVVADEVIVPIEEALLWHLSNESELFRYFQNTMREKVLTATISSARRYLPLSPLAICESQRTMPPPSATHGLATNPPSSSAAPAPSTSSTSTASQPMSAQQYDIERIGMRLGHIGVLHWRVWASLLYLRDEIADSKPEPTALV
ncbi:Protein SOK1 [Penicillium rolfsii]|nr:Protein SOK1 [Penicillium rolfsii]